MRAFHATIKNALSTAPDLIEVERLFTKIISKAATQGKQVGFVVGKISPTHPAETFRRNKELLGVHTKIISQLAGNKVVVFSAEVTPEALENTAPIEAFYTLFDDVVRRHIHILYTTPGWEQSKGATNEVRLAREKGIEIRHYKNNALTRDTHPK